MMQSFMEDTLTSYPWVPIIYILLAMSVHRYDEPEVAEEFYVMEEAYDDTTYDDTSYEGNQIALILPGSNAIIDRRKIRERL